MYFKAVSTQGATGISARATITFSNGWRRFVENFKILLLFCRWESFTGSKILRLSFTRRLTRQNGPDIQEFDVSTKESGKTNSNKILDIIDYSSAYGLTSILIKVHNYVWVFILVPVLKWPRCSRHEHFNFLKKISLATICGKRKTEKKCLGRLTNTRNQALLRLSLES